MSETQAPLYQSSLKSLPFLHRGKVRDLYAVGDDQLLIVQTDRLSAFDVILDDGNEQKRVHLNRSYQGLYVCPMIWRELDNFSSGSVCMVLASNIYDESDYYREYEDYLKDNKRLKQDKLI